MAVDDKYTSVNKSYASSTSRIQRKMEQFNFTWYIQNFSMLPKPTVQASKGLIFRSADSFDRIKSSPFTTGEDLGRKDSWELILYPYKTIGEEEFVSIYLQKTGCDIRQKPAPLRVCFTISVVGTDGNEHSCSQSGEYRFHVQGFVGWDNFMPKSKLENENGNLLHNDVLTVLCKMVLFYEVQVQTETAVETKRLNSLRAENGDVSNITLDFNKLYENQICSDVILQVGKEEFRAHKAVLCARSPVFANMFQTDMEESRDNRVQITDIDGTVLSELLRYIYSGEISEPSQKVCLGLYIAADKYFIPLLMQKCSDYLMMKMSEECVVELARLSYLFDDKRTLAAAKQFIVANALKVMATRGWMKLVNDHPELADDIIKFQPGNIREADKHPQNLYGFTFRPPAPVPTTISPPINRRN